MNKLNVVIKTDLTTGLCICIGYPTQQNCTFSQSIAMQLRQPSRDVWALYTEAAFLYRCPGLPKLPSQFYSNGPGDLGNLGSSKEIQPDLHILLRTSYTLIKFTSSHRQGRIPNWTGVTRWTMQTQHPQTPRRPHARRMICQQRKQWARMTGRRWHGVSRCSMSTLSWITWLLVLIKVWGFDGMGERRETGHGVNLCNLWCITWRLGLDKYITELEWKRQMVQNLTHNNLLLCFNTGFFIRNFVVKLLLSILFTSSSIH